MTLSQEPKNPPDRLQRARALHDAGQLEEAAALYREALSSDGDDHRAMHGLGLLALQTGALHAAEPLLRGAVQRAPDEADYHVSLGQVLQASGRPLKALASFRRASTLEPLHYEARYRLAVALHRTGELEKALEAYEQASVLGPGEPALLVNHGALLNLLGRSAEALPLYEEALRLRPDMAAAHGNLGNALAALDRHAEAIAAFERSLELAPDQPKVYANLGSCQLAAANLDAARGAFMTCLQRAPGDITSLAMLAAILNEQGERQAASALMDFDGLMHYQRIEPMAEESLSEYLSTLRASVLAHPTLRADPDSHTTRHGQQTGSLWPSEDPAIRHLVQQIRAAVSKYIAGRPASWRPLQGLPALWPPPGHFQIDMWATVLGGGGHQAPHIHPSGWLSGVFYVEIPMAEADTSEAGWIEFGCQPEGARLGAAPLTHRHRPLAGELVLFPSYFFHRTLPLTDDKPRISIAFDVIPRRGA